MKNTYANGGKESEGSGTCPECGGEMKGKAENQMIEDKDSAEKNPSKDKAM